MIRRSIGGTLLAGVIVTAGFMIYAGEPADPGWWLGFLAFFLWALLPFAIVALMAYRPSMSQRSLWVLLAASVLLTVATCALLYTALIVQTDAQSALVFVVLPIWQLIALPVFLLVAFLLRERAVQ